MLLTRDVRTLVPIAWGRVANMEPMPGVIVVPEEVGVGQAIDEILLIAGCHTPEQMNHHVLYLPL